MRAIQHWRPYICPFECLIRFVPANATVLDIGCGGGLFLGLLAASGPRIASGVGFDVSHAAIATAQQMAQRLARLQPSAAKLSFQQLDVSAPWPAGSFDVVSLIDFMHHVAPPAQRDVLIQAAGHVAPGGVLIYKDMCRRPLWRASANRLHDLLLARQWIHHFPIEDAERSLAETGMSVVHRERLNRLWYGHDLLVFSKSA